MMNKMRSFQVKNEKFGLVALLCLLFFVIIGLLIGIVVMWTQRNEGTFQNSVSISEDALEINDAIQKRLETDPNYNVPDAELDYLSAMSSYDVSQNAQIAFYYADFYFSRYGDLDGAIKIMEKIDSSDLNSIDKITYYMVLRNLCNRAGDTDCFEYYQGVISKLLGEEPIELEKEK